MINKIIALSKLAGISVMKYFNNKNFLLRHMIIRYKNDISPVTIADKISHDVIIKGLRHIDPETVIISEESRFNLSNFPSYKKKKYWLIDPLDGTKEFINNIPEFTINISLIKDGYPILGVIYVPCFNIVYFALFNESWKIESNGIKKKIVVKNKYPQKILTSRSHTNQTTNNFINKLEKKPYKKLKMGSSLKFCYIAEGKAQLYVRCHPIYTWDISAGHAILLGSGGYIYTLSSNLINYKLKNNNSFLIDSGIIASSCRQ
ncbi:3'(2'),5'-bisphosphate nucleotidase CysQ [Buchnera aphidicola (Thelaxes suberi)]|uniref:3'(2'),5'-bisphosphate nucleotidase CysQ family protein n=1 Tax=Buchnera aphidicola TaxID=9 RepID=UPI003464D54D